MGVLEHRPVGDCRFRLIVDVAQEHAVIALAGDFVDSAQDLDVERVAHIAGDHAEQ
jgi:hypothetical protein